MIKVEIDTKEVAAHLGRRARDVMDKALDAIGELAMDQIQVFAKSNIASAETREAYLKSIEGPRKERNSIIIEITDPKMIGIENGVTPFEIKPGLLKGPNVKKGKSGPYQDVPFEHKVTKRGKGTFVKAKGMRSIVAKAMEEVKKSGETKRLFTTPSGQEHTNISDMKVYVTEATVDDKKVLGVVAKTFRRVSNKSKAEWLHPGFDGVNAFKEAGKYIEDHATEIIMGIAEGLT